MFLDGEADMVLSHTTSRLSPDCRANPSTGRPRSRRVTTARWKWPPSSRAPHRANWLTSSCNSWWPWPRTRSPATGCIGDRRCRKGFRQMITVAKPLTFSSDEVAANRKVDPRMAASRHPVSSGRRRLPSGGCPAVPPPPVILLLHWAAGRPCCGRPGPWPPRPAWRSYLRHVLGFSLWQALLHPAEPGVCHPGGPRPGATPFSPDAACCSKLFLASPGVAGHHRHLRHGRGARSQGWLPQLLHGLGLDPGNYLYGLFGILLAHVSSTCRWPPASSCRRA